MSIDPDAPEYAWQQLAAVIEDRIATGKYTRRLPSESSFSQEFGLARNTVRRAMEDLRGRGLVVTIPQRGTFVKRDN
ncbi:winged helix-turn-helix domain-containing protein [Actinocatenispora sera]|uniref:winged helix-turn-helix domain-containing protein n=1 Tax=Actinocatenispora sera TaxID=390989 RepID=UPI003407E462